MNPRTRNSLLLLLSVAAGCVDAIAFLKTGVFPANMTGNSVVLGSTLLHPSAEVAGLSALALAGFCVGAAAGALLTQSGGHTWTRRTSAALLAGSLLVLGCAGLAAATGDALLPLLIAATAAAMGLQSAAVQQLGVPGVSTVFVTGTLTTAIMRLVGRATQPPDASAAGPWLPAFTWLSYFAGAILGGLHRAWHLDFLFVLPGAILLFCAAAGWPRNRR